MSDWFNLIASYELADFILFTPETYFRLFELHNEQWWWLLPAIGVAMMLLTLGLKKHREVSLRSGLILLGLLWCFIAWSFLHQRYGQLFQAASAAAWLFALQGLLIMFSSTRLRLSKTGLTLVLYAILIHPLLGLTMERTGNSLEFFGLAPDTTALASIGLIAMMSGRWRWALLPVPLTWCLLSGLTLYAMEIEIGLSIPALAFGFVVIDRVLGNRSRRPPAIET